METTFDKFITNNEKERKLFEQEYASFALSELIRKQLQQTNFVTINNVSRSNEQYAQKTKRNLRTDCIK
ncbi:hypothetical protein FACS189434_12810 [Bacteroidia bacterium]|nr:hypothetical protein FACS189434_12810 [Bacteroidia bacterium]